jgi:GR25 family glycosyltransferase involved in LPS biosynthesis
MRAVVISIRPERVVCFRERSPLVSFVVVAGVDGATLDLSELESQQKYTRPFPWSPHLHRGEVGCSLSHQRAWNLVDQAPVTIFEDDCVLRCSLDHIQSLVTKLAVCDPKWKVLLLGRNSQLRNDKRIVSADFVIPGRSWGLFGYVVSPLGAKFLTDSALPISEAVDTYVSSSQTRGIYALRKDVCGVVVVKSDTWGIV